MRDAQLQQMLVASLLLGQELDLGDLLAQWAQEQCLSSSLSQQPSLEGDQDLDRAGVLLGDATWVGAPWGSCGSAVWLDQSSRFRVCFAKGHSEGVGKLVHRVRKARLRVSESLIAVTGRVAE